MQSKKIVACLTAGLLISFGATAENYHWDNVAMDGAGFVSGVITSKSERGVVFARTHSGTHSGAHFAVNGFGSDAVTVGSAAGFNFAGAWSAAPQGVDDKASWINISAFDVASQLIGTTGNIAIRASYKWVGAALGNVSSLSITRDTGWYVMDDFTTTAAAAVPEPGTQLMLGTGLLALVAGRRRPAR